MDFSKANKAMQRMFYYLLQDRMGENSLQRQMRYLQESNRLYGQRASEALAAEEASRKRLYDYSHEQTMEEKAADLDAALIKLPYYERLQRQIYLTRDPKQREAMLSDGATGAELFGVAHEMRQRGEVVPATLTEKLLKYADPPTIEQLISGAGTRRTAEQTFETATKNRAQREAAAARTATIQQKNYELNREKFEAGVGVPGAMGTGPTRKEINTTIAREAEAAMRAIESEIKDVMDPEITEPAKVKIRDLVNIKRRAASHGYQGEVADRVLERIGAIRSGDMAEVATKQLGLEETPSAEGPETGRSEAELPVEEKIRRVTVKLVAKGVPQEIARKLAESYYGVR